MQKEKAILVVSFGTSYHDTRKKTIDQIERDIRKNFPEYKIYRAWTSKMIINKLKKRDGIHVPTVKEAAEAMLEDGITDVVVQPTHVINGIENDIMTEDIMEYADRFSSVCFGAPLLNSTEDNRRVIECLMEEFNPGETEALIFMGHGTSHYVNSVYAGLDYMFKDLGHKNVFMGTVEAYPTIDSIMRHMSSHNPRKITLAPFMIVAGDHAVNDMAGDNEDSWKCQFEQKGYPVTCILKGLGEFSGIREVFIDHIKSAIS